MPTPPTVMQAAAWQQSTKTAAALWLLGSLRSANQEWPSLYRAKFNKGVWRNGSASDSRSEGWEFESLCPQPVSAPQHLASRTQRARVGVTASLWHTGSASDSRSKVGGSDPLAPKLSAVGKQHFGLRTQHPG